MIIIITQPTLYPWIGFFDIIKNSDIFVFLDDVQFNRHGWQQNNRIKDPKSNEEIWLNIPVKKTPLNTHIKDIQIDNSKKWQRKHIGTLDACYGKNFKQLEWLQELFRHDWKNLCDFNIEFIKQCCNYLDIKTKFFLSSELDILGTKTEKLVNICKYFNAGIYFTTIGAKDFYLKDDEHLFENEKIKVMYHNYEHPTYTQRGDVFVPYLSILDLILNCGDDSKKFFKKTLK